MPGWTGELHLGEGWLCYLGPLGPTDRHAHLATQLVLARSEVVVEDGSGDRATATALLIGANQPHALHATGQSAAVVFLSEAAAVGSKSPSVADWVADGVVFERVPPPSDPIGVWAAAVVQQMAAPAAGGDVAVLTAMELGLGLLPGPVPLRRMAPLVGVSASVLGRRFTDHVGVPWRQWVLARRLAAAAAVVAGGATLTEAAHHAGFSDSAHLARTFRRMFGIAPSVVASGATWHLH